MNTNFNSNFYITTATVIPVLYVALIVQFPMMDRISKRLTEINDTLKARASSYPKRPSVRIFISSTSIFIIYLIGGGIIVSSLVGEIESILALYRQSDNKTIRSAVLLYTIFLLIATFFVPTWTILAIYARMMAPKELRERVRKRWQRIWQDRPDAEVQSPQGKDDA
jgi:hypothetical protein